MSVSKINLPDVVTRLRIHMLLTMWGWYYFCIYFWYVYMRFSLVVGDIFHGNQVTVRNWLPPFLKGIDFVTTPLLFLKTSRLIMIYYEANASWVKIFSTKKNENNSFFHQLLKTTIPFILRILYNLLDHEIHKQGKPRGYIPRESPK